MKIIDSHTHLSADTNLLSLQASMREAGIDRLVFSNLGTFTPYPDSASVRTFNEDAWRLVQRLPDHLSFLVYLNPQNPDWQAELDRHQDHAVGVKLWISQKHPDTGSLEATLAVLRECARRRLPVLLHVFNRTYGNLPGEIHILEAEKLAEAVPDCTLIAAHAGACEQDSAGIFRRMPANLHWDISGSYPANGLLERLLAEIPARRILYGSDGMGRNLAAQVMKVTTVAGLTATQKEDILWRNAARIYHLPEPHDITADLYHTTLDRTEDFHCYCGQDPFGLVPTYSPRQLQDVMQQHGVQNAYCVNLTSLLHWDPSAANRNFLEACRGLPVLRPLWTVNPQAHNADLVAGQAREHGAAGIWASAYWGAVPPDSPCMLRLGALCQELGLPFFVHLGGPAEDRFRVPAVTPRTATEAEISHLLAALPACPIILQSPESHFALSSSAHRQTLVIPREYTATPQDGQQQVWGSGFPYRSFPQA